MYLDRRLWAFTSGVRLRILWAVVVGLVAVTAGIARLALLGWLLAEVLSGRPPSKLVLPLALVAGVIAARGALEYYRNMVAHRTAARVQAHLRQTIYDQVAALGPSHFSRERTGDVIVAMVEGIQQLEVYFGQYLPQLFVAALTPFLIFGLVAFVDLPIAVVLLGAALVSLVAPAAWHRMDSRNSLARQEAYAAYAADFLDSIQGLATLKAFGQSGARGRLLEERGQTLFRSTMGVLGTNTLGRGITDTAIALGAAVALAVGVYRVRVGDMELAALLVILMLGVEVFRPLRELRVVLHSGMLGRSAAQAIFRILDAQPLVHAIETPDVDVARSPATIAFEDVTFSYPGARGPAHEGLSFSIGVGEQVGIVGPSGSGKSTVAKLLLRLYDPQHGRVRLGGQDIRKLTFDQLRSRIAVVSQDTYLFHGTVEENLRMGKPDATIAELESAARAANAHVFIERLPQGYQTVVGERGVRLSGGQRQRIAIARALLRDAPILVLDEALSSVDAESEALIQAALDRLMQGRTTLIFAHRLSSVVNADRILALDGGRVAEAGTHAELMLRNGAYHRLMAEQAGTSTTVDDAALYPPDARDGAAYPQDAAPYFALGGMGGPFEAPHPKSLEDAELVGGSLKDADLVGGSLEAPEPIGGSKEDHAPSEPTDAILRAEGLNWTQLVAILLGMVRRQRGQLTATFLLGVARVAALIGVGVVSALAVLAVRHGEPVRGLLVLLFLVAPLAGILHWVESWLAHDLAYRMLADMRVDIYRKLDALAPAYMSRRRTGDLVGVATHDVELVEYFFAHTITPAFVAVLVPTAVLATLVVFGWPMAVALVPFLAYAGLSPVLARSRIDRLGSRAREASGDLNAHAVDSVQGLAEIIAFQHVRARGEEFAAKARRFFEVRMPFLHDLTLQTALQEVATGLGGLAILTVGALLVVQGRLDAGVLPLLTLLAMSAFVPVWEIAQVARQLADTLASTRRVHAVHSEPVAVTDGPGVRGPQVGRPALEMTGVGFTYPGRPRPALTEVTFSVPAGSRVALVGPSGAGKTTVASLFLRFWDPDKGVVRMHGHDLREYRLDDLRRQIALVAQDTYLFNDTLQNNILLAKPSATPAEVAAAVERASLGDFVASLPDGLETSVGERGAQLSGGQRQRVAIARAFLKDAPVLILDEATSHLDAVNERAVRAALDDLSRDRTTVVIAHRLSTVRDADQIVVLDEGRVAEIGAHGALLERGGLYAHLVSRQIAAAAVVAG